MSRNLAERECLPVTLFLAPPGIDEMDRQPPGADHEQVESNIEAGASRMGRQVSASGAGYPLLLPPAQGFRRLGQVPAGLDLDHGESVSAPRHDIDFTHGGAKAAGQDAVSAQPEMPSGKSFRVASKPPCLPFGFLGARRHFYCLCPL